MGTRFSARPDRPWGPPSLLYNGYRVFFPRVKRRPPTPFSAEVKERVQLHLYSPSGPSWPVLGWTLLRGFLVRLRLIISPYSLSIRLPRVTARIVEWRWLLSLQCVRVSLCDSCNQSTSNQMLRFSLLGLWTGRTGLLSSGLWRRVRWQKFFSHEDGCRSSTSAVGEVQPHQHSSTS